VSIVDK